MLGTAAMRSTRAISVCLTFCDATSLMKSAVQLATGNEMMIATKAMVTVPVRTAATPKVPRSGSQAAVVRKENPLDFRA